MSSATGDVELKSSRLQVVFRHRQDRYAHEVWWHDGKSWTLVLESVEGTPSDDWPPSPPLQFVHREERGEHQVALGVGMAGTSHWSLSVELDPVSHCAKFDLACRVRGEMQAGLGSTYRASAEMLPSGELLIARGTSDRLILTHASPHPSTMNVFEREFCLGICQEVSLDSPRTMRWSYEITVRR